MINSLVHSLQEQVKSWFSQAQAQATEKEKELIDLPEEIQTHLRQKIRDLPTPKPYLSYFSEAIATGVETWQENVDAPNHLVILTNPVESTAKIVQDTLDNWQNPPVEIVKPLACLNRRQDPQTITEQFEQALQPYKNKEERNTLIVIPALEQCFLRSIGGWDGIEYWRDLTVDKPNYFWVIGCNQWAWDFLDFVSQISAYFREIKTLPELDGEMLQDWLKPILITYEYDGCEYSFDEYSSSYWNSLASRSSHLASIAVRLWLDSLGLVQQPEYQDNCMRIIQTTSPALPNLPSLSNSDRYLLHSVLIHSQITRAHLALSLGETRSYIQSGIQDLLSQGLLEQEDGILTVGPLYYTKLKTELTNNNFFVGRD